MIDLKKQICTISLIAINVIVFLGLTLIGSTENIKFMFEHGALFIPSVLNGEYYRVFTAIFLHFGFEHLVNNMLMLYVMGTRLEYELGMFKYVLIYLISGLCGNITSALREIILNDYVVSAGASGAVFGLTGALLYMAIKNNGQICDLSKRGLLFIVVLNLYYGFATTGINNAAHIGGLVSGFILAAILYKGPKHQLDIWFEEGE